VGQVKVLLVNPPQKNLVTNNIPSVVDEERGYNPPLGLLYVAAHARENTPHEIAVLDAVVLELDYPALRERIAAARPDVVGVTATTFTLVDAALTIKLVKEINKGITVVLGGPHPYIYPDESINLSGVDFLVIGEGEEVFSALLNNLRDKDRLRKIPGLVYKDGGEVVIDYRGEGDTFGFLSMVGKDRVRTDVVAVDDTICYLLGQEMVLKLLDSNISFTEYFLQSHITRYIDKTYREMQDKSMFYGGSDRLLFTTRVGDMAIKNVVFAQEDTGILRETRILRGLDEA